MKPSGFTLVELLVVIALIGILLALAAMNFGQMTRKSAIEKQITEMYQEIVRAQEQAMHTRRQHIVTFGTNSLIIRRFASETDLIGAVTLSKALPISITLPSATNIVFNTKGIMVDPIPKSICIESDVGPNVDSIVIVQSQISLGQMINQGAGCGTGNIFKK